MLCSKVWILLVDLFVHIMLITYIILFKTHNVIFIIIIFYIFYTALMMVHPSYIFIYYCQLNFIKLKPARPYVFNLSQFSRELQKMWLFKLSIFASVRCRYESAHKMSYMNNFITTYESKCIQYMQHCRLKKILKTVA